MILGAHSLRCFADIWQKVVMYYYVWAVLMNKELNKELILKALADDHHQMHLTCVGLLFSYGKVLTPLFRSLCSFMAGAGVFNVMLRVKICLTLTLLALTF